MIAAIVAWFHCRGIIPAAAVLAGYVLGLILEMVNLAPVAKAG